MSGLHRLLARSTCGLIAASLISLSAATAFAEVTISDRARTHFNAGVNLLQDPDGARYEEAYREFQAAYADSPSWKILGNLGLTAMKLERDGEAIEAFQKYLAEGGAQLDPEEKAQVERDLATLTSGVVQVEIEILPAGASLLDERVPVQGASVKNVYDASVGKVTVGVRTGHHHFTARLAGYEDQVWEVEARPGQALQHRFDLQPAKAATAPGTTSVSVTPEAPSASSWNTQKTVAAVVGGVGVVGVAVGTVFFFNYKSKNDDAKDVCPSGTDCPPGSEARHGDLIDDARSARTVTYIGWGVGAAALAGAAALYFTAPKTEKGPTTAIRLAPAVAPGLYGAALGGSF